MEEIIKRAQDKMNKSIEALRKELSSIRTGRATPALIENIHVDYYGASTPIKQLANISIPESKQILIQPYDKGSVADIDRALQKADLGAMPKLEGSTIRIILPPLTEERRKDIVKNFKKFSEETKIAIRNIRREFIDEIKAKKEKKEYTEDQVKHLDTEVQKLTDKEIANIESLIVLKEKEIMEV